MKSPSLLGIRYYWLINMTHPYIIIFFALGRQDTVNIPLIYRPKPFFKPLKKYVGMVNECGELTNKVAIVDGCVLHELKSDSVASADDDEADQID